MTSLTTADLHLTDKAADEYRWKLFEWLPKEIKNYEVKELLLLGDITDAKDHHPARLVNRLFICLKDLSEIVRIIWLKGNHDYYNPENPFFQFIKNIPNIDYISNIEIIELSIGKATFIPAGTNWNFQLHQFPYCFTHATFDGAEAENGRLLPGIDPSLLKSYTGKVISGDIHVPQKIRDNIEYVGAPYHIRFGDSFEPRLLLITNEGNQKDLKFPAPHKHVINIETLEDLQKIKIDANDQVKIRCHLHRADYDKRKELHINIKKLAEEKGWSLSGFELLPIEPSRKESDKNKTESMTHMEMVESYAKRLKASENHIIVGQTLIKEILE